MEEELIMLCQKVRAQTKEYYKKMFKELDHRIETEATKTSKIEYL